MSYQNSSITETTSTSWFTRIKNSVVGVLFGLLLLVAGVVGLFWNEGRAVTTARSLEEGAGIVMSVAADRVDAANEGKLIHVTGSTTTDSKPSDADFGIVATGLRRWTYLSLAVALAAALQFIFIGLLDIWMPTPAFDPVAAFAPW